MAKIKLTTKVDSEVLVVGLGLANKKLQIESGAAQLDSATLLATLNAMGATAKADEVIKLPGKATKLVVFTGLGEIKSSYEPEVLRRAAGAAARHLNGNKSATFSLPHKSVVELAAIAEGAALGSYTFVEFLGSSKPEQKAPLESISLISKFSDTAQAKSAIKRAEIIAEQTYLVRDLINTPPSHLTPDSFSQKMKKLASKYGVKAEIINDATLKKSGYGGIIGVGQGSANPPRLLHVSYSPAKAKKRYAFVGKGITFDTGGLALKPAAGMEAMKSDMSGAAAVIAAVFAISQLKLPIAVDGWAPLAENMVSDNATRPSDVITIYGGKTVEVLNPDAEGRLVLADALWYTQDKYKPQYMIDLATLTGAITVALGFEYAGLFGNDDKLCEMLTSAGTKVGEPLWRLPMGKNYDKDVDSDVADVKNVGSGRGAGSITAAQFLERFVNKTPWAHLDIAGMAWDKKEKPLTGKGATGYGVRLLNTFLMDNFEG